MRDKNTQWMIYAKRADFNELSKKYGISPITARILINRGVEPEKFNEYLSCNIKNMNSPWLFKDMDISVKILREKIEKGRKIRVIGDYDVDGICSTYILTEALSELGADVDMDIPDRIQDGYGININIIKKALDDEIDTIITCDNGISAINEIKYAREHGMTVIVTDHHEVPLDDEMNQIRVDGNGVIDPKQQDCPYPYKNLCGASVAYKLMEALWEKEGKTFDCDKYIEPAAVATICDVVDLNGENRIIAKCGLDRLKNPRNIGLKTLMEKCRIESSDISSYHVGFIIGPCLNAGGRLDTAKKAYNLINTKDYIAAGIMADELRLINEKRKKLTEEAVELFKSIAFEKDDKSVLVLYSPDIHESIAGIVAGRIREEFYKPVFVMTDSEEKGVVKGSGRSIEGYNMFEKISECSSLFIKAGGHSMAAGFSIKKENLEILEKTLNDNCGLTQNDLTEKIWLDVRLPFSYNTEKIIKELSVLEPFGKGNEKPVFAEKDVELLGFEVMGRNKNALKMILRDEQMYPITAMYFGDIEKLKDKLVGKYGQDAMRKAVMGLENDIRLTVSYYPQINEYNGRKKVQIVIKNYKV